MSDTPSTRRPYRLCRSCHQPHTTRNARCTRCQPIHNTKHNQATAYYQTPEWNSLRAQCLDRDYHQCVICTGTNRLTAHHIIARANGGPDTLTNLVTLCHRCHQQVEHGNPDALHDLRMHLTAREHL